MSQFFNSFLFKLILTVLISIFIGFQLSKIELKEARHSFRKILGVQNISDLTLEGRIQNVLKDKSGEYAVLVKDLKPGGKRNIYLNSDQEFPAASLYKLFLMGAVFNAMSDGKITMDTQISAKLSHLDDVLGSREFGYEEFDDEVIGYTVKEALERIAGISDNYSAIMLAEKITWNAIQAFADEIGTTQTEIKDPITTSAEDVGLVLEKLYRGEVVSFETSQSILDMLSKSQLNNRIPAKLPEDIKIAHKTGELSRVRNDAGVVFLEGNPYVIVLMTKNLEGEDEGVENLAEISKIVYDYYASNPK